MKSFFKNTLVLLAIFFFGLTGSVCVASNPFEPNQMKVLSFMGVLADQSDQGNSEAKFLLALMHYSISKDSSELKNTVPSNAVQAYLLASLYALEKNNSQSVYWMEQSKALLKNHTLNVSIPINAFQNYDTQKLNWKTLAFMGDVATEVENGNPEARTILKMLSASADKNYSLLVEVQPSTATEAYFVAALLMSDNNAAAYSFLDKARHLISVAPPAGTVVENLPPLNSIPENNSMSYDFENAGETESNSSNNNVEQKDSNALSSDFLIPEEELKRIETLSSEHHISEEDRLLLDGARYYLGKGVPKNYQLAAANFLKLANKGNPFAQAVMGTLYDFGQGVPKNPFLAAKWYEKSIQNGNKWAYNNMGASYEEGSGVSSNAVKAEEYYKKAIAFKTCVDKAHYNLGTLYYKQHKYSQAESFLVKACQLGVKDAEIWLAHTYDAQKKYNLSFPMWKKVALRGNALGIYNLAVAFANAEGTPRSIVKAYYCAGIALNKGDSNGQTLKVQLKRHLNSAQIKKLDSLIQKNTTLNSQYI